MWLSAFWRNIQPHETLLTICEVTWCNNPENHIADSFCVLSEPTVIREAVHLNEEVSAIIHVHFLTQVIVLGGQEHTHVSVDCLVAADLYLVGEWLVIQTLHPHMHVHIVHVLLFGHTYGAAQANLEVLHVRVQLTNFHILHRHSF